MQRVACYAIKTNSDSSTCFVCETNSDTKVKATRCLGTRLLSPPLVIHFPCMLHDKLYLRHLRATHNKVQTVNTAMRQRNGVEWLGAIKTYHELIKHSQ